MIRRTVLMAWLSAGLLLAAATGELQADPLYVQSNRAAVFDGPGFDHETLGRLDRGAEVERLESRDDWHHIETDEMTGWMPGLLLREEQPVRSDSDLDAAADLGPGARRRASAVTTAGAIRGVDEDERLLDDPDLDVEQLHRLEAMAVTPEEALAFMAEEEEASP